MPLDYFICSHGCKSCPSANVSCLLISYHYDTYYLLLLSHVWLVFSCWNNVSKLVWLTFLTLYVYWSVVSVYGTVDVDRLMISLWIYGLLCLVMSSAHAQCLFISLQCQDCCFYWNYVMIFVHLLED